MELCCRDRDLYQIKLCEQGDAYHFDVRPFFGWGLLFAKRTLQKVLTSMLGRDIIRVTSVLGEFIGGVNLEKGRDFGKKQSGEQKQGYLRARGVKTRMGDCLYSGRSSCRSFFRGANLCGRLNKLRFMGDCVFRFNGNILGKMVQAQEAERAYIGAYLHGGCDYLFGFAHL